MPAKQIDVNKKSLVHRGDSLHIDMEVIVQAGTVGTNEFIRLTPAFKTNDWINELPSIVINGKRRNKAMNRMIALNKSTYEKENRYATVKAERREATRVDYKLTIPYESWMNSAEFLLLNSTCGCAGLIQDGIPEQLAARVTQETPPKKEEELREPTIIIPPAPTPVKEPKELFVQHEAFLKFPIGSTVIMPTHMDNAKELENIHTMIATLTSDPNVRITKIEIAGYASPDGTYQRNKELSEGRAYALRNEVQKMHHFDPKLFHVEGKGEDWKGLEELVTASNMDKKDKVLHIIRTTGIFTGREKMLMDLSNGEPYRYMYANFFPKLRRSVLKISYRTIE